MWSANYKESYEGRPVMGYTANLYSLSHTKMEL